MGNNLFGANISGQIADAFGGGFPSITLRKITQGARDATNPVLGRTGTNVDTKGKGTEVAARRSLAPATIGTGSNPPAVKVATKAIMILGDTLKGGAVLPEPEDQIFYRGKWYTVISVDTDPDAATHTCQCHG